MPLTSIKRRLRSHKLRHSQLRAKTLACRQAGHSTADRESPCRDKSSLSFTQSLRGSNETLSSRGCTLHSVPIYIEGSQRAPARPEANHNLVCLGRLVREKGVLLAANAAAAEDIPLTFIGSGPLAQQIHAACPNATITGWVDRAASVQYLRQARALIFPSLWYETLGLVVLEAAAHGIPSLVSDGSAAREIVVDGVTGLHFKAGDEFDLAAKMRADSRCGSCSQAGPKEHSNVSGRATTAL